MAYYIVYFDKIGGTVINVSKYSESEYFEYMEAVFNCLLNADCVSQHGYF